jgi:hypothetical protein
MVWKVAKEKKIASIDKAFAFEQISIYHFLKINFTYGGKLRDYSIKVWEKLLGFEIIFKNRRNR